MVVIVGLSIICLPLRIARWLAFASCGIHTPSMDQSLKLNWTNMLCLKVQTQTFCSLDPDIRYGTKVHSYYFTQAHRLWKRHSDYEVRREDDCNTKQNRTVCVVTASLVLELLH